MHTFIHTYIHTYIHIYIYMCVFIHTIHTRCRTRPAGDLLSSSDSFSDAWEAATTRARFNCLA